MFPDCKQVKLTEITHVRKSHMSGNMEHFWELTLKNNREQSLFSQSVCSQCDQRLPHSSPCRIQSTLSVTALTVIALESVESQSLRSTCVCRSTRCWSRTECSSGPCSGGTLCTSYAARCSWPSWRGRAASPLTSRPSPPSPTWDTCWPGLASTPSPW